MLAEASPPGFGYHPISIRHASSSLRIYTFIIYVCMYVCMYIYICIYLQIDIDIDIDTDIDINIDIYI